MCRSNCPLDMSGKFEHIGQVFDWLRTLPDESLEILANMISSEKYIRRRGVDQEEVKQ